MQAASRLEIHAAKQLINERERLVVLHDPVALADNAKHLIGVLANSRVITREAPITQHVRQIGAAVNRQAPLRDAPPKPRSVDRLSHRRRRTIKHRPKPMPRHLTNRKHRISGYQTSGHHKPFAVVAPHSRGAGPAPAASPAGDATISRASRLPRAAARRPKLGELRSAGGGLDRRQIATLHLWQ
jgi:hypothetical protein